MKRSYAEYAQVFKVLSDTTRLRILEMLSAGELCACHILSHFNISQPTLSYHMRLLTGCGLVKCHRDGAWMKYTLNRDMYLEITQWWQAFANADESDKSNENK